MMAAHGQGAVPTGWQLPYRLGLAQYAGPSYTHCPDFR